MKYIVFLVGMSVLMCASAPVPAAPIDPSYAVVKRAMSGVPPTVSVADVVQSFGAFPIDRCSFDGDFTGTADATRTGVYAAIANGVLWWERGLPKVAYPARVWQPWVSAYETAAVATANRVAPARFAGAWEKVAPNTKALARILLAYRASHKGAVDIDTPGGCGAGETPVKVVTVPAAAQVSIIPTFFFELCRVQHIDPNDQSRCGHWRDVTGDVTPVSGDYHYIARWHGGAVRKGTLLFDASDADGVVTLRKP